eukprot:5473138-Pyramimonas_sp.AAC.1
MRRLPSVTRGLVRVGLDGVVSALCEGVESELQRLFRLERPLDTFAGRAQGPMYQCATTCGAMAQR